MKLSVAPFKTNVKRRQNRVELHSARAAKIERTKTIKAFCPNCLSVSLPLTLNAFVVEMIYPGRERLIARPISLALDLYLAQK